MADKPTYEELERQVAELKKENAAKLKHTEEALKSKTESLTMLLHISNVFTETHNSKQLLQIIADKSSQMSKLNSTAIYLLEEESLYLAATFPPLPKKFPEEMRIAPLSDHPHIGRAISTKQPVILPDSKKAALTKAEKNVIELRGLRSNIYLPLVYNETVLGILIISSIDRVHHFTKEEINVLQILVRQASVEIVETRLFEENITRNQELLKAKEEAEANEKKFRNISEQINEMVFITNDKGIIKYISPASETVFGLVPEKMEGVHFMKFLKKTDIPKAIKQFLLTLNSNEKTLNLELNMKHGNGNIFVGELSANKYITENFKGTIGVIRDITERKKAEKELEKYHQNLEGLVKERTKELEEKNQELEKFNQLFIGREFRIKELRDKVMELEEKLKNK